MSENLLENGGFEAKRIFLAEIEVLESGSWLLHLRIPMPSKKAFWIAVAFIALVLLLRSGLVFHQV
jgi:hypothetical protein